MTVAPREVDIGADRRAIYLAPALLENVVADLPSGWTGPVVLDLSPSGLVELELEL